MLRPSLKKSSTGYPRVVAEVIAEIRANRGISQEQLAEVVDSTNVYICLLENGLRKPSLNATILIAQSPTIQPDTLVEQVITLLKHKDVGNADGK